MLSKKYKGSKKGSKSFVKNFSHQESLKCCSMLKINKKHMAPGTGAPELIFNSWEALAFTQG